MNGKESYRVANFATFVPKTFLYISIESENDCNKIELSLIQNRTHAARLFDIESTRWISDLTKLFDSDWPCFFINTVQKRVSSVQKLLIHCNLLRILAFHRLPNNRVW